MRTPLLPLTLLFLSACGASPLEYLPEAPALRWYDTGVGVLSHLGEPCHRRQLSEASEAWDYCGREECPPGVSKACMAQCTEGCARGWTFYLLSGVVVRYEPWGME